MCVLGRGAVGSRQGGRTGRRSFFFTLVRRDEGRRKESQGCLKAELQDLQEVDAR